MATDDFSLIIMLLARQTDIAQGSSSCGLRSSDREPSAVRCRCVKTNRLELALRDLRDGMKPDAIPLPPRTTASELYYPPRQTGVGGDSVCPDCLTV